MKARVSWTLLLAVFIGCGPHLPPATVSVARPELEPFRAALERYIDATQPFRRDAASKSAAVPSQTGTAPGAEVAVRLRERTTANAIRTEVRPGARQGDIFSPPVADLIRREIEAAFKSPKVDLIRDELQEQNEGHQAEAAAPQVNQSLAAPRVPPMLLSILPELPEQVEFDFHGRTLLIRDVDANIVVDFIPDALPEEARPPETPETRQTGRTDAEPFVLPVPSRIGTTVFALIGDSGTGDSAQHRVAQAMLRYFTNSRRFAFVLMLGDNLYHDDYTNEFLVPYRPLLDRGVTFYAALGNHDRTLQKNFKPFNMNDRTYYAFTRGNARFVALDSNQPNDRAQHEWFDGAFGDTGTKWRIAFFHHPLYSSGQHAEQSRDVIRPALESALVRNKVDVVFSGHEHLYERISPQRSVRYFVSGGGGRNLHSVKPSAFDEVAVSAHHFMVVALSGDQMFFEAIATDGRMLDCGLLWRTREAEAKGPDEAATAWLARCRSAARPVQAASGGPLRRSAPLSWGTFSSCLELHSSLFENRRSGSRHGRGRHAVAGQRAAGNRTEGRYSREFRKLEPTFRQSNAWRPKRAASSAQTSIPR